MQRNVEIQTENNIKHSYLGKGINDRCEMAIFQILYCHNLFWDIYVVSLKTKILPWTRDSQWQNSLAKNTPNAPS